MTDPLIATGAGVTSQSQVGIFPRPGRVGLNSPPATVFVGVAPPGGGLSPAAAEALAEALAAAVVSPADLLIAALRAAPDRVAILEAILGGGGSAPPDVDPPDVDTGGGSGPFAAGTGQDSGVLTIDFNTSLNSAGSTSSQTNAVTGKAGVALGALNSSDAAASLVEGYKNAVVNGAQTDTQPVLSLADHTEGAFNYTHYLNNWSYGNHTEGAFNGGSFSPLTLDGSYGNHVEGAYNDPMTMTGSYGNHVEGAYINPVTFGSSGGRNAGTYGMHVEGAYHGPITTVDGYGNHVEGAYQGRSAAPITLSDSYGNHVEGAYNEPIDFTDPPHGQQAYGNHVEGAYNAVQTFDSYGLHIEGVYHYYVLNNGTTPSTSIAGNSYATHVEGSSNSIYSVNVEAGHIEGENNNVGSSNDHTVALHVEGQNHNVDIGGQGLHVEGFGNIAGRLRDATGTSTTGQVQGSHLGGSHNVLHALFDMNGLHIHGAGGVGYTPGQHVQGAGPIGQASRVVLGRTSIGVNVALFNARWNQHYDDLATGWTLPDYNDTLWVEVTVVGRSNPRGAAGVWKLTGLLDGDASGTYRWVGGSAPTATVEVADQPAQSWGVALELGPTATPLSVTTGSGEQLTSLQKLDVVVTNGDTVDWVATVDVVELPSTQMSAYPSTQMSYDPTRGALRAAAAPESHRQQAWDAGVQQRADADAERQAKQPEPQPA